MKVKVLGISLDISEITNYIDKKVNEIMVEVKVNQQELKELKDKLVTLENTINTERLEVKTVVDSMQQIIDDLKNNVEVIPTESLKQELERLDLLAASVSNIYNVPEEILDEDDKLFSVFN